MPIYSVKTKLPEKITSGEAIRLVKAKTKSEAAAFVAKDTIHAELAGQEQLVVLVGSGVRVENVAKNDATGVLNGNA